MKSLFIFKEKIYFKTYDWAEVRVRVSSWYPRFMTPVESGDRSSTSVSSASAACSIGSMVLGSSPCSTAMSAVPLLLIFFFKAMARKVLTINEIARATIAVMDE